MESCKDVLFVALFLKKDLDKSLNKDCISSSFLRGRNQDLIRCAIGLSKEIPAGEGSQKSRQGEPSKGDVILNLVKKRTHKGGDGDVVQTTVQLTQ